MAPLQTLLSLVSTADPISIQKDPSNPKLFTNRAVTRLRLQSWDACIDDCLTSIELEPGNMKGYYYLAQAQLALHHPNEALNSAMTAYEACLKTDSSSTRNVSTLVLQAKKEKWEAKERERIRRRSELLEELENGLGRVADYEMHQLHRRVENGEVSEGEALEEKEEIELSSRKKIEELRNVFGMADPALKTRVRPTSPPDSFYTLYCGPLIYNFNMLKHKIGSSRLLNRQHLLRHHARSRYDQNRTIV